MAHVQIDSASSEAGGNTVPVNMTVTAGNSLLAFFAYDDTAAGTPAISGGGGDGWTLVGGTTTISDTAQNYIQRVWVNNNITGGAITVTATANNTGRFRGLTLIEISETPDAPANLAAWVAGVGAEQTAPGAGATGCTSGNATPPTSNWIAYGMCANWNGDGTPAANTGGGWTDRNEPMVYSAANFTENESQTGTGTSAMAATFTRGSASTGFSHYTTIVIIAQEAGGGGGVTLRGRLSLLGAGI